jgi:hypothetical protein
MEHVPPAVRLVAPNDLAVLFLPGPFDLVAEASDAEGPLSSVDFLAGDILLATRTNAPFAFSWTNAPVGTNRLTARATDQFGARATSSPVTVRIRFPNALPSVAITSPETNSLHALPVTIEVIGKARDAEGPLESVRFYFNRTNLLASLEQAPFVFGWTNAPAGTNQLTAVARDSDGASVTSAPVIIRVVIANVAPVFAAIPDQAVDELVPLNLTLNATDADEPRQTLTYGLVSGPAGLSVTAGGALSWTPTEAQGPTNVAVRVSVTDGLLSVTNQFTVAVREVNVAPVLAAIPDRAVDELTPLALALNATDADEPRQMLTYGLVSGPEGVAVTSGGALSWMPTEAQGPTNVAVRVSVTDGLLSVTNRFNVAVREVNELPTFLGLTNQSIPELSSFALPLAATDPDLPTQNLSVAWVAGPAGSGVTNGVFAWLPDERQGPSTNEVRVVVTDGQRTVTNAFTVIVTEVNTAPVLVPVANRTIDQMTLLVLTLTATDADEPVQALTFSLVNGPADLTVTPAGRVSWAPRPAQFPSTNVVAVRVGDGQDFATNTFTVFALPVDIQPTVTLTEPIGSVAYAAPGYVKLQAEARSTNAAIARVEFLAGTNVVGSVTSPPYRFSWDNVPAGDYVITARAVDTQGIAATNGVPTLVKVTPLDTEPLTTFASSPTAGETGVAVTRETVLRFTCPLRDDATVSLDRFNAVANGRRVLSRIELSTDRRTATLFYLENLPASSRVRVTFNGTGVFDCLGRAVDADGDGQPGGVAEFDFDTLATVAVARTAISGRVFASEPVSGAGTTNFLNRPLQGVTITVDGAEETQRTTTDAQGNFRLEPCPSGRFFVHVDGRTAEGSEWPNGAYYPFVGKAWDAVAGRADNLANGTGEIFLPRVPGAALQAVSATEDTRITFAPETLAKNPDLAGVSITVPANSLLNENGARGGRVGIAAVPPDRLPEPLPPGLNFPLVITVQTDGPMNFDRPVPVRFPNLPDPTTGLALQPGETTTLWSFVHDTGRWEPEGTMTVSADGRFLDSDPGSGIRQPGWHGWFDCPNCCPLPPLNVLDTVWDLAKAAALCAGEFTKIKEGLECLVALVSEFEELLGIAKDVYAKIQEKRPACEFIPEAVAAVKEIGNGIQEGFECVNENQPVSKAEAAFGCLQQLLGVAVKYCDRVKETENGSCEPDYIVRFLCLGFGYAQDLAGISKAFVGKGRTLQERLFDFVADRLIGELANVLSRYACKAPALRQSGENKPNDPVTSDISDQEIAEILSALESHIGKLEAIVAAGDAAKTTLAAAVVAIDRANEVFSVVGNSPDRRPERFVLIGIGETTLRHHGTLNDGFNPPVPRNVTVRYIEYFPTLGVVGENNIQIPAKGFVSLVVNEWRRVSALVDSDQDGLCDLAEVAVGTDSTNPDTDRDGIPDGEEVRQGTDPLDGRVALTGVINSLAVTGTAVDVSAANDVVALAAAEGGVTLFNTLNPARPLRVGQVDTPGNCVAVASLGTRVVAADGDAGVALIDFSDPANPQLVRQVGPGALGGGSIQAVAAAADIAFAGSTSGKVSMLDLATGAVFQTLDLGGKVEDLAIEGLTLYAYAGDRLHVLPFGKGLLERGGSVVSPAPAGINTANGRGRLFVGGEVAYVTHTKGFNTFSVSDPANPRLLAAGDTRAPFEQFGWKHTVANGSGRVIAAFSPNQAFDGPHNVGLFDARDLNNGNMNDKFLTQFETPGIARAVTLYNGLAYMADHGSGMQVLNYLPPDTGTNGPTGLLLVSVAQNAPIETRRLTVANAGFEEWVPQISPGYVRENGPIPGWQSSLGVGISPGNGFQWFTDNGQIPEGARVVFMQEDAVLDYLATLRQAVHGFEVGKSYQVSYRENARVCCAPSLPLLKVEMGGQEIVARHRVARVGGQNTYAAIKSQVFEATAPTMELVFEKSSDPATDDTSVLIDDVHVTEVQPVVPNEITVGSLVLLRAAVQDDVQVRQVEFFVNNQRIAIDGNFPFEAVYRVPTNSLGTPLVFSLRASDMGGNNLLLTNSPVTVRPDAQGPAVAIDAPVEGSDSYLGTTLAVELTLLDNVDGPNVAAIGFEIDGQRAEFERLTRTSFMVNTPTVPGRHTLVAIGRDFAGNEGRSAAVHYWRLPSAPDDDFDHDGLSNREEIRLGTDPTKADTDGDGIADGREIEEETDPLNLRSRPSFVFLAQPPVEIVLADAHGLNGTGVTIAGPLIEIVSPGTNSAPRGVAIAQPLVELVLPGNDSSARGVTLAQPPIEIGLPEDGANASFPIFAQPEIEMWFPGLGGSADFPLRLAEPLLEVDFGSGEPSSGAKPTTEVLPYGKTDRMTGPVLPSLSKQRQNPNPL